MPVLACVMEFWEVVLFSNCLDWLATDKEEEDYQDISLLAVG